MAFKRGEGKYNADIVIKNLYNEYKNKSKNPISFRTYSLILNEYNDRIIKHIIYSALEYKMPYRLGYIRIQRRKKAPYIGDDGKIVDYHLGVDWQKSLALWRKKYPGLSDEELKEIPDKKKLKYLNEHTNGYSARFYWDKNLSNVRNQSNYVFRATRTAKEILAAYIKKIGRVIYLE